MKTQTGNVFSDSVRMLFSNPVLVVPAVIVSFINLLVYAFSGKILNQTIFKDLLSQGFDFSRPRTLPWDRVFAFFGGYWLQLTIIFIVFSFYSLALSSIHRAGWGNMFARTVIGQRPSINDYLSGVGKFFSRMLWLNVLRSSILCIPALVIMIVAVSAIAINGPGKGFPAFFLILIPGMLLVFVFDAFALFYMLPWRAAMLIRDMQVVEALFDGMKFAKRQWSALFVCFIPWLFIVLVISSILGAANNFAHILRNYQEGGVLTAMSGIMIMMALIRWAFTLLMKMFLSMYYYRLYFLDSLTPQQGYPANAPMYYQQPARQPDNISKPDPHIQNDIDGINNHRTGDEPEPLPPGFC